MNEDSCFYGKTVRWPRRCRGASCPLSSLLNVPSQLLLLLLPADDVTVDDVTLPLNAAMTSGHVTSSAVSDSCNQQVITIIVRSALELFQKLRWLS